MTPFAPVNGSAQWGDDPLLIARPEEHTKDTIADCIAEPVRTRLTILVAEDDLGDILLLKYAFQKAGVQMPVHFARDGREVLNYLDSKPPFDNPVQFPLPDLLLLDLKLPLVDGFEILQWLRSHPALSQMLVIVLSSSARDEDFQRAHALGANSYIVKPNDPSELVEIVRRIEAYWLGINAPAATAMSI